MEENIRINIRLIAKDLIVGKRDVKRKTSLN